jgi:branched-chain amino acid transport system permease protein
MTTELLAAIPRPSWKRRGLIFLVLVAVAAAFPFGVGLLDGQSPSAVLAGEAGNSRFLQGLAIEIFILALYAISYDLILGVAGLLSVGHAMFFAVGAYTSGILLKSFGWGFWAMIGGVIFAALLQALLFAVVLPRVRGIPYALVTLGLSSVFFIVVGSSDLSGYTGADVGLHGVPVPRWIDTSVHRLRLYLITLAVLVVVYWLYRLLVASSAGSVMIGSRENEDRALMLGYNTFWFKLLALVVSSVTAALAGTLFMIHQPIITPNIAGLGWTVAALLMILIGGIGTLSGAIIGAFVFRLLQFYLERWFGNVADLFLGSAYILIVLFLPYGIVGTWRLKRLAWRQGWRDRARVLSADKAG